MYNQKEQIASKKIIEGLKAGNSDSFKEVFILFEKKLYYFVFSITKSEYIAEEIIQEVFIKVWENRESLDPSRSFDSFIYTMTRNLTYNYLRDASHRQSIQNELWTNINHHYLQVEEEVILAEYQELVQEIVRDLPQQKRSIYQMSREQGKSNSEIAYILGLSPKTVKNHLWETMRIIKSKLGPYLENSIRMLIFFILMK